MLKTCDSLSGSAAGGQARDGLLERDLDAGNLLADNHLGLVLVDVMAHRQKNLAIRCLEGAIILLAAASAQAGKRPAREA